MGTIASLLERNCGICLFLEKMPIERALEGVERGEEGRLLAFQLKRLRLERENSLDSPCHITTPGNNGQRGGQRQSRISFGHGGERVPQQQSARLRSHSQEQGEGEESRPIA